MATPSACSTVIAKLKRPPVPAASLGSTKAYNVYAWWTQGGNRSVSDVYHIDHAGGTTTSRKNQQGGGGAWQLLGSWSINSGSRQVRLSCWTTTGYIVVADAVRWQ